MRLVEVRCGARGCGKLLGTIEAIAPRLPGDPAGIWVSKRSGNRIEAVVPADFAGDLEVEVCPRHFRRVDGDHMTTSSRRLLRTGMADPSSRIKRITMLTTGILDARLLREPFEKARLTGKTQVLPVR